MERLSFVVSVLTFWLWSILVFGFVSKVSANAEGACSHAFSYFWMHFLFLLFRCVWNMEIVICIC
jgi:hypothetical protein